MNRKGTNAPASRDRALLDDVERAIIGELKRDPRVSNREIAERLELTTAQVLSRIRRIEERNVAHVVAVLDAKAIGQSLANFRVAVRGRAIAEVAEDLALIENIGWLAGMSGGEFDLAGAIRFGTLGDLLAMLSQRIETIAGVANFRVDLQLERLVFRGHHISFTARSRDAEADIAADAAALEAEISEVVQDSLDRHIIAELCHNGRTSSRELARKYGVNAGTIRYRLRALEARGIVALRTLVDPAAVGLNCFVLVELEVEAAQFRSAVSQLSNKPWLPYLMHTTGKFNLSGLMLTADWEEAEDLRARELRTLQGLTSLTMSPLTRNYKVDPRFS